MASLTREANGNYTVQVVCGDGKRRSIRLGKINKKHATEVKLKVEQLHAAASARLPLDGETARWIGDIGDKLAAKLAAVGLIAPRNSSQLGTFLAEYIECRKADSKPGTLVTIERIRIDLTAFYGEDTNLRDITEACADELRTHYLNRKLAAATIARRLKSCRMVFKAAMRKKLVPLNPFAEVRVQNSNPKERKRYVFPEEARQLIEASNPTWRIIIALCRFAGMRCPSEVLSLKWEHVNWETDRMTVPSCKTEHLPGKAYRVVPIFAELRPYLVEAFELAEEGAEYVVPGTHRKAANTPTGWGSCNLRTQFEKIIRRAGLTPWPRLFHNMRASCETDLMARHPIHVACGWIGNTQAVALEHYAQTLQSDFDAAVNGIAGSGAKSGAVAVQNAVQSPAASDGHQTTRTRQSPEIRDSCRVLTNRDPRCHDQGMTLPGLEPGFWP